MAVIRSRAQAANPVLISNPEVERARKAQLAALDAARAEGQAAAAAELKARAAELDRREQAIEADIKKREQELKQQYEQSLGAATQALNKASADMPKLQKRLMHESEQELVRLALALSARVLRREVHTDPAWFDDLLRAALAQVPSRRPVVLRMHPEDAELVRDRQGAFAAATGGESLEVVDDPSLARGGCRVVCAGTEVDAGVDTGWQRLAETLLGAIPEGPAR